MSEWLEKLSKRGINVDNERQRQIDKHNAQHVINQLVKMTAERDALLSVKQQNAELVAQVEVLKNHMVKFTEINSAFDAEVWESESVLLLQSTPNQCLRQIQADAGRTGFMECARIYCAAEHFEPDPVTGNTAIKSAYAYADRIKRGGN